MSSPINTGDFLKALWPGVNAWYGKGYNDWKTQYEPMYDTFRSELPYEEDVGISSFPLAKIKTQGDGIQYASERQGFVTRYTHVEYALGFMVTRIMMEDNQYDAVVARRAPDLARSMRQTKETVAANVYNRAFNNDYVGGDGKELCANDHPNVAGGTWSNVLTTPADLSEAALEQACIDIMGFTDDAGLKIQVQPKTLIISKDQVFEAERILMSPYRVGTSNNDVNALYNMGKFKNIHVNQYLTDPDAWFIRNDVPHGMKHFIRRDDDFQMDNDFDTENAKYKATARYAFGWTNPRDLFGSPGA